MKIWLWFAFIQGIFFLLMLIGWVLLIPFCAFRLWRLQDSAYFPGRKVEAFYLINAVYGNPEDSVLGNAQHRAKFGSGGWGAYWWSAWRNSVNQLKYAPVFQRKGGPFWRWENGTFYAQAGWYPNGAPVLSAGRI